MTSRSRTISRLSIGCFMNAGEMRNINAIRVRSAGQFVPLSRNDTILNVEFPFVDFPVIQDATRWLMRSNLDRLVQRYITTDTSWLFFLRHDPFIAAQGHSLQFTTPSGVVMYYRTTDPVAVSQAAQPMWID